MKKVRTYLKEKYFLLLRIFPVKKNKIVFQNFQGRGYGDNVKYIAEKILEKKENFELVWLCNHTDDIMPNDIKKVKYRSAKGYFELATAGIWIDNVRNGMRLQKKQNQIYIQTWHGGFTPKLVEGQVEKTLLKSYVDTAKRDGQMTDAILAVSDLQKMQFEKYFWLNKKTEILKVGLPRNDTLIKNKKNRNYILECRKSLGLLETDYVILHAPTFRDGRGDYDYGLNYKKIKKEFSNKIGKDCKIVVRLHPNVSQKSLEMKFEDGIINGTNYADAQELILLSDCIITDYSSMAFDFALLEKPVILYVPDLIQYQNTGRLTKDFFSFPFLFAKNEDELLDVIRSFREKECVDYINFYFQKHPFYDKGNASEEVIQWIKNKQSMII